MTQGDWMTWAKFFQTRTEEREKKNHRHTDKHPCGICLCHLAWWICVCLTSGWHSLGCTFPTNYTWIHSSVHDKALSEHKQLWTNKDLTCKNQMPPKHAIRMKQTWLHFSKLLDSCVYDETFHKLWMQKVWHANNRCLCRLPWSVGIHLTSGWSSLGPFFLTRAPILLFTERLFQIENTLLMWWKWHEGNKRLCHLLLLGCAHLTSDWHDLTFMSRMKPLLKKKNSECEKDFAYKQMPLPLAPVHWRHPPDIRLKQSWANSATKVYKHQRSFTNNPHKPVLLCFVAFFTCKHSQKHIRLLHWIRFDACALAFCGLALHMRSELFFVLQFGVKSLWRRLVKLAHHFVKYMQRWALGIWDVPWSGRGLLSGKLWHGLGLCFVSFWAMCMSSHQQAWSWKYRQQVNCKIKPNKK